MKSLVYRQSGKNRWKVLTVPSTADRVSHTAGYVTKTTGLRLVRGPGIVTSRYNAFNIRNRKLGTAGTLAGAIKLISMEIS